MDPRHAYPVKELSKGKHASEQMQPYIRPLDEDMPRSLGPDEICASSLLITTAASRALFLVRV